MVKWFTGQGQKNFLCLLLGSFFVDHCPFAICFFFGAPHCTLPAHIVMFRIVRNMASKSMRGVHGVQSRHLALRMPQRKTHTQSATPDFLRVAQHKVVKTSRVLEYWREDTVINIKLHPTESSSGFFAGVVGFLDSPNPEVVQITYPTSESATTALANMDEYLNTCNIWDAPSKRH
jgi:hypothetical protein